MVSGYGRYVDYCIVNKVAPMSRREWKEKCEREIERYKFICERYGKRAGRGCYSYQGEESRT